MLFSGCLSAWSSQSRHELLSSKCCSDSHQYNAWSLKLSVGGTKMRALCWEGERELSHVPSQLFVVLIAWLDCQIFWFDSQCLKRPCVLLTYHVCLISALSDNQFHVVCVLWIRHVDSANEQPMQQSGNSISEGYGPLQLWYGMIFQVTWNSGDLVMIKSFIDRGAQPRHARLPIRPLVLEATNAEHLWQGILDAHPVPFWRDSGWC